ncbi:hypothetical protein PR048_009049 [Dryococelus australis]|uniref:PiggyBac transposable element-derived protein domain-containing protein n=1 Tax=Dryococelus australis TaxID=614101 RepID=A0ABQ9HYT0_9NEOP|nr:hypothetical protein PR048_009049 [Dryococelus australis]
MRKNLTKLYKLRPVFEELLKKFGSIPIEETLSVDEQICPTKGRPHLKLFMPSKPHKWGSNYVYFLVPLLQDLAEISPTAAITKSTLIIVIPLSICLCSWPTEEFSLWGWYDEIEFQIANSQQKSTGNKSLEENWSSIVLVVIKCVVCLLATFVGIEPEHTVRRHDRNNEQRVVVKCPAIICDYNRHMSHGRMEELGGGGVDLLESLLGRHHISIQTRKWYMRLFYHVLDVTAINAWFLRRRINGSGMKLSEFRVEIAITLRNTGHQTMAKRGRSSTEIQHYAAKKAKGHEAPISPRDIKSTISPFGMTQDCDVRIPFAKKQTFVVCQKSRVNLCLKKYVNCFLKSHSS